MLYIFFYFAPFILHLMKKFILYFLQNASEFSQISLKLLISVCDRCSVATWKLQIDFLKTPGDFCTLPWNHNRRRNLDPKLSILSPCSCGWIYPAPFIRQLPRPTLSTDYSSTESKLPMDPAPSYTPSRIHILAAMGGGGVFVVELTYIKKNLHDTTYFILLLPPC
jgi:hypothetical protein